MNLFLNSFFVVHYSSSPKERAEPNEWDKQRVKKQDEKHISMHTKYLPGSLNGIGNSNCIFYLNGKNDENMHVYFAPLVCDFGFFFQSKCPTSRLACYILKK